MFDSGYILLNLVTYLLTGCISVDSSSIIIDSDNIIVDADYIIVDYLQYNT